MIHRDSDVIAQTELDMQYADDATSLKKPVVKRTSHNNSVWILVASLTFHQVGAVSLFGLVWCLFLRPLV